MWDILAWIVVGGAVGFVTNRFVSDGGMGVIMDMLVGIVGASLGGALLTFIVPSSFVLNGFNVSSLLIALVGAGALLLLMRAVSLPRRRAAS